MKTFFVKFTLSVSLVAIFHNPASAGYLEDVAAGNVQSTQPTSAASSPEATKPLTAPLLKCAKNYGRVVMEDKTSPIMQHYFIRVKLPEAALSPTIRHAIKQAGCFTLVEAGTAGVKSKLRVEMMQPTLSSVNTAATVGLSMIPIWGTLAASANQRRALNELHFSSAMVSLTVIDTETGEEVAAVVGQGKSEDTSLGVALLGINTPDILSGDIGNNVSLQVIATEFADGFNKLVPLMDKQNQKSSGTTEGKK